MALYGAPQGCPGEGKWMLPSVLIGTSFLVCSKEWKPCCRPECLSVSIFWICSPVSKPSLMAPFMLDDLPWGPLLRSVKSLRCQSKRHKVTIQATSSAIWMQSNMVIQLNMSIEVKLFSACPNPRHYTPRILAVINSISDSNSDGFLV